MNPVVKPLGTLEGKNSSASPNFLPLFREPVRNLLERNLNAEKMGLKFYFISQNN